MHRITTIAAFQEFTRAFMETAAYRNPVLFAIGGAVKTRDGIAASVRYPVVNGYMKNTGTAAILMKILGIQPKGVQNVPLTKRQLQEMLYFFKPFENDGVNHQNIQVLKMAENLYHDKDINSPGDAVASFIFDADSPVLGMEDATLRLYGRSLSLYQAHDSHLSEILMNLPSVIWENDVPINQDGIDEDLLSAAFGGKVFAPNMASKVPLLIHRINIGKLGRITPRLNTARLGTYVDEGGNIRHI